MLNVSPTIAIEELEGVIKIANKWIERLKEGVPFISFPAPEEDYEKFMKQMIGELRIAASKSDSLADVFSGIQ